MRLRIRIIETPPALYLMSTVALSHPTRVDTLRRGDTVSIVSAAARIVSPGRFLVTHDGICVHRAIHMLMARSDELGTGEGN